MRLYRGTTAEERRRRLYGFSWTTSLDVARDKFAEERRVADGGAVVLETDAPPDAILLVREKEDYFDEGEVVVITEMLDPGKESTERDLERMNAIHREIETFADASRKVGYCMNPKKLTKRRGDSKPPETAQSRNKQLLKADGAPPARQSSHDGSRRRRC